MKLDIAKQKKIEDEVRLSIVLSKKQSDKVKRAALYMSNQKGIVVSVSEMLRELIERQFSVEGRQMDLF